MHKFVQALFKNFSNRKIFRGIFAFGLSFILFSAVSAQTFDLSSGNDTLQGVGEFASILINVFTFLSLLILSLVGDLLGTDMITGPEAMATLRPMWIFVRNMTNIMFVLVLVFLAFSNLVGSFASEQVGQWTIKEKLPRILLGLVLVNFSLLGARLAIDAIHFGSITVFSLADTQLESHSATSTNQILNGTKWRLINVEQGKIPQIRKQDPNDENKFINEDREFVSNPFLPIGKDVFDLKDGEDCKTPQGYTYYYPKFDKENKKISAENLAPSQTAFLVCGSFGEQINSMFCPSDDVTDKECKFRLNVGDFDTFLTPGDNTAQNLFLSFGTVFMKLDKLPSLAADVESLFQVIDNTLFAVILAIAYVVVLVALFVVLVARILILWLAIVFSPAIIGLQMLGVNAGSGSITDKVIGSLVVPLKVAAAFTISFVMMSGMIEFNFTETNGIFQFGAALSDLGLNEYAIMWQVATIVIFWEAAQWALKDAYGGDWVVSNILESAKKAGEFIVKATTTEAQIIPIATKDGQKESVSVATLFSAPEQFMNSYDSKIRRARNEDLRSLGVISDGLGKMKEAQIVMRRNVKTYSDKLKQPQYKEEAQKLGNSYERDFIKTNAGFKNFYENFRGNLTEAQRGNFEKDAQFGRTFKRAVEAPGKERDEIIALLSKEKSAADATTIKYGYDDYEDKISINNTNYIQFRSGADGKKALVKKESETNEAYTERVLAYLNNKDDTKVFKNGVEDDKAGLAGEIQKSENLENSVKAQLPEILKDLGVSDETILDKIDMVKKDGKIVFEEKGSSNDESAE